MNFKPKFTKKGQKDGKPDPSAGYEPVTKYMATDLITFTPETDILEVINTLLEKNITGAPVLNERKELIGLIDDKDCLRVLIDSAYHNQPVSNRTVRHYMTNVMQTISVDANVVEVANEFLNSKYKRFLVLDDTGKLVGQVSRRDILRAIRSLKVANWNAQYTK
jgi:CBS domain-containing protein